jgi:hypothetical protein
VLHIIDRVKVGAVDGDDRDGRDRVRAEEGGVIL